MLYLSMSQVRYLSNGDDNIIDFNQFLWGINEWMSIKYSYWVSAQYILGIIINIASTSIWYNKNP